MTTESRRAAFEKLIFETLDEARDLSELQFVGILAKKLVLASTSEQRMVEIMAEAIDAKQSVPQ